MKKLLATVTLLTLLLFVGCATPQGTTPDASVDPNGTSQSLPPYEQRNKVNIAIINGPTGMGASKLMKDNDDKLTKNQYTFSQYSAPTDIMPLLINGELDIAALPTNVAATVYNNTKGKVKLLALNTLGVLYVLSNDDSIDSIDDLKGKTVYSSGQGSTPEYALDYILTKNNIKSDVKVEYVADHASLVAMCVAGQADTVVLPEPFVTTLLSKDLGYKNVIDLNAEWDKACNGEQIFSMGCIVVRDEFAKNNPQAVLDFYDEYAKSVEFVNNNAQAAAEIIASYKIVASAELAQKAIPNCNIVCISAEEKTDAILDFLKTLHEYNPKSVGGTVPDEGFICSTKELADLFYDVLE